MTDSGYDISLPLVRMAKNVNYIYDYCYHENIQKWNGRSSESRPARLDGRVVTDEDKVNGQLRYAVEIDGSKREQLWAGLPIVKRMSCIYNAMTIATKMIAIATIFPTKQKAMQQINKQATNTMTANATRLSNRNFPISDFMSHLLFLILSIL